MLSELHARMLLEECLGDHIWSLELCRQKQVPDEWIVDLADCFESGFRRERDTIYYQERVVNQFQGVRDLDLAFRLAEFLGVDTQAVTALAWGPLAEVRALREAVDE